MVLSAADHGGDVVGELDLRVVLRLVADDLPSVRDRPERTGVVADAVEDLEGHAVVVGDRVGLDGAEVELLQVAFADPAGDVAQVVGQRSVGERLRPDRPRRDDPDLRHLDRTTDLAGRVEEAEGLVGGLGPAVEAVRTRIVLRSDPVAPTRAPGSLVPLGGLVGAGAHHPADAAGRGRLVDPRRHVEIDPLGGIARLPGRRPHAAVHDRVDLAAQLLQPVRGVVEDVQQLDPFHLVTVAMCAGDVDQTEIEAFPECGQQLPGDVARRPRDQDSSSLVAHRPQSADLSE